MVKCFDENPQPRIVERRQPAFVVKAALYLFGDQGIGFRKSIVPGSAWKRPITVISECSLVFASCEHNKINARAGPEFPIWEDMALGICSIELPALYLDVSRIL